MFLALRHKKLATWILWLALILPFSTTGQAQLVAMIATNSAFPEEERSDHGAGQAVHVLKGVQNRPQRLFHGDAKRRGYLHWRLCLAEPLRLHWAGLPDSTSCPASPFLHTSLQRRGPPGGA